MFAQPRRSPAQNYSRLGGGPIKALSKRTTTSENLTAFPSTRGRTVLLLLAYGWSVGRRSTLLLLVDATFNAVMNVGTPWLLGLVVLQLGRLQSGGSVTPIAVALALLLVLLGIATLLSGLRMPVLQDLSLRTEQDVLVRLTALHLASPRITHLQDPDYLDRTQRARNRVWEVSQGVVATGEVLR